MARKLRKKPRVVRRIPALMAPLRPSDVLGAVIGYNPLPRTQVVKKLWAYIKKNKLQDKKNKRNINPDDKPQPKCSAVPRRRSTCSR